VVGDPHFNAIPPHSRNDDYAESMFKKLAFIYKKAKSIKANFIMYLGDFSHRTTQPTEFTSLMLKALNMTKIPQYCLVGNHDTYAGNIELIDKTFLGNMFAGKALKRANKEWTIGDVTFKGYDYKHELVNPEPFETEDTIKVAFAHAFIQEKQENFRAKDYLSLDGFKNVGCDHLFVGHDHIQYPVKNYKGMRVYRGGSLSRGTKHKHQMEKTPIVYACRVNDGVLQVGKVKVPCNSKESVYDLLQMDEESMSSLIKDFVTELKTFKTSKLDVFKLVEDFAPDDEVKRVCFDFLKARGLMPEGAK
jgi:DNA repair exonuclease SbcCD nuclease subunit